MSLLMSMVMGFVQGVAEFLPISSSGHLTLLQHFFGMKEVDNLFHILLHFATLLAVCVVYWKDIVDMVVEFFRGFASLCSGHGSRESRPPTARRLVLMVIVGTLPLFVVLPLEGVVEQLGNYPAAVSVMLILTGFILFFSDRMGGGRKNARTATMKDALLVGIAQGVATIPGISRSGSTISAGMLLGFDRKFAVRYSCLRCWGLPCSRWSRPWVKVWTPVSCPTIWRAWWWPAWWGTSPSSWCACWPARANSAILHTTAES